MKKTFVNFLKKFIYQMLTYRYYNTNMYCFITFFHGLKNQIFKCILEKHSKLIIYY